MKIALAVLALTLITAQAHAQESTAELPALDVTTTTPEALTAQPTEIEAALDETPQSRAEAQWAKMPDDGFVKTATYSEFFFLPAGGENSAQFNYRQASAPNSNTSFNGDGSLRGTESNRETRDYDLHYARSIARSTYLNFDLGYESETVSYGDLAAKSNGLKDLGIGLTQIARFDRWNLLYGSNFTASPASAYRPTLTGIRGNRFSGGYAAIPFVGFESTSHSAAWGGRLKSTFSYSQYGASGFNDPLNALALDAFYEVPVLQTLRVGFNFGAERNNGSSISDFHSIFDSFAAGAYTRISLKQQADVLLGIVAKNHDDSENSSTETAATVGLRKTL